MQVEEITKIKIHEQTIEFGDWFGLPSMTDEELKDIAKESAIERFRKKYPDLAFDMRGIKQEIGHH